MYEELLAHTWALDAAYHNSVHSVAMHRLGIGKDAILITKDADKAGRIETRPVNKRISGLSVAGNVRVIPIEGVMMRNGKMCSLGTEQIVQLIADANADPSIASIVLKINSPGGTVDGTELLGDAIRTSPKPTVAYVAGTAASAAYWVASQATEIIMESATTAYVGSIGVVAIHEDAAEAFSKEGRKITIIRADGSENKMLSNPVEGLSDELLTETKARLNVVRDTFVAAVKAARPHISDSVFDGKAFHGSEAVKLKMADRIGNMEVALGRAMFHAKKQVLNQNSNKNTKAMSYMKLEAVLGGALPEGFPEESALALEGVLVERDNRITELEAATATASTRITELEAAETNLEAYTATNLSAEQVVVLNDWYENAKNVGAGGNGDDANNQPLVKKMSAATAQAAAVYQQLHGKK